MRLRYDPPPQPYEWMRADPDYDDPRPLSVADFGPMLRMVPAAVVTVAVFLAGVGFALAVLR